MAGLEITIGGDASDFEREVRDVEKQLQTLERRREARVRVGADTGDLDRRISGVTSRLNQLRTTANNTAPAMDRLSRSTANGSNTLTQFSRIAQDAPFGIMGIGNNLTATAEAFGNLTTSAGGAGNALRAVASSIMGVGGILLAVSLVTTGLTYMSQNGLTVGDVFNKLNGKFDETAKALSDMGKEAAKTAGEEIAGLKALVSVAQDDSLSREKRLIAVKKLQDEYPAYFGNLRAEQILNGNVATAIDDVSKALRARAMASAIAGKLGELAGKRLELEEKREQSILAIQRAQLLVAKNKNKISTSGGGVAGQGGGFTTVDNREKEALKSLEEEYKNIVKEIQALDAQSKKYSDRENQATKDSILLFKEKGKAVKESGVTPQVSSIGQIQPITDLIDLNTIKTTTGEVDKFGNKIKELPGIIKTGMDKAKIAFDMSGVAMLETLQKFNDDANSIIQDSLVGTFNNLGSAIGEAIASGQNVFSAIGKSLLGSLGAFISDMGGLLIKYGTLAVAKGVLDQAIATGGPFAVAAGIAAIGVGIALKAAGSAISAKAKGGASSAETGASYSSPSQSTMSSGSSSFGGGNVVFEIRGTTLIGVLNNTLDQNRRLGGNLPIG